MECLSRMTRHELEALAWRADGRSFPIGTACSGFDGPVLALRTLVNAINKVCFTDARPAQVGPMEVVHEFSCEINAWKRRFLMQMFDDLRRMYKDVQSLSQGEAEDLVKGGLFRGAPFLSWVLRGLPMPGRVLLQHNLNLVGSLC